MGLTTEQLLNLEQIAFQIVSGIVTAAPIIIADFAATKPYVDAIVEMAKNGGQPTDEQWATVRARLDDGSALILRKAQEAQAQIDANAGIPGVLP